MLRVRDRVAKNVLEKCFGDSAYLVINQLRHHDAATTRRQALNLMVGDSFNIVALLLRDCNALLLFTIFFSEHNIECLRCQRALWKWLMLFVIVLVITQHFRRSNNNVLVIV